MSSNEGQAAALALLDQVWHGALATVNEDGSPHNSPLYLEVDWQGRRVYWSSNPTGWHSRNVARARQAFAVFYDAERYSSGLYLRLEEAAVMTGAAFRRGLAFVNARRRQRGKAPLPRERYDEAASQRLYGATIAAAWFNRAERDADGRIERDVREEITLA